MENKTLDQILNVICPKQQYWVDKGHKCFGRFMEKESWMCKSFIRAGVKGCKACREWVIYGR
jgi:hypothetical protein